MKDVKNYHLIFLIILSAIAFSILGHYWNVQYYQRENIYTLSAPPLATAMKGIHDKLYYADYNSLVAGYSVNNLNILAASAVVEPETETSAQLSSDITSGILEIPDTKNARAAVLPEQPQTYDFTTATEDYFQDACFIGDTRTVDVHIKRIREKLEEESSHTNWRITTVWGVGYKFEVTRTAYAGKPFLP